MIKNLTVFGIVVLTLLASAHVASAASSDICIFGIICLPTPPGHGHPAPAPLLAAGIPAFTALGGGVLFARLFRRGKKAQA